MPHTQTLTVSNHSATQPTQYSQLLDPQTKIQQKERTPFSRPPKQLKYRAGYKISKPVQ